MSKALARVWLWEPVTKDALIALGQREVSLPSYRRKRRFPHQANYQGLFGMLKRKRIYRTKYPTLDAARNDVFE